MDIETIFAAAIEKTAPGEREKFLGEACQGDSEVRARVDALLQAHDNPDSFLERPDPDLLPTAMQPSITEKPGSIIGPYKLLQQLGEGGMGVVYMAEQLRPVERRVALKIIKPGMDSKQVIARFEAERQALAMMDHPNIAKILDAGMTESGRPYFVMELVKGIPMMQYCDKQHLTPRERLELFIPVCQAVQHAHQKGVIHRDLKPSNVLIALYDDKPVPKVIDFGVAKATSQKLTEKTMFTEYGQIVGTLEYMSPEQANLNQLDIDTRSDIYSLGVLLYELLTGVTPFDSRRLRSVAFDDMMRIIREEEPPKPSTRLSTIDTLPSVASNRRTEPKKLSALIHGELDWIVMRSLEKERGRRYGTASSLADDIQRFLTDEPVEACPPSTTYRLQKFACRNFVQVAVSATFALLVVSFAVYATLNWQRQRYLVRELAVTNQQLEEQKQQAVTAQTEAEHTAEMYRQTLEKHYDVLLEKAIMAAVSGDLPTFQAAIDDASHAGASSVRLKALRGLAAMFAGQYDEAVGILEKVVEEHPESVTAWASLFWVYDTMGNLERLGQPLRALEGMTPADEFDVLLMGHARMWSDPLDTVEELSDVVERQPTSMFARALLADALAYCAESTGEIEYADRAMAHVAHALAVLPDDPFILSVALDVHTVSTVLGNQSNRDTSEIQTKADSIAAKLEERFPDYLHGRFVRAVHFTALQQLEEADKEWVAIQKRGGGIGIAGYRLGIVVQLGRYEKLPQSGRTSFFAAYFAGDREKALQAVDRIPPDAPLIFRLWGYYIRNMCGQHSQAIEGWEALQEKEDLSWWIDRALRLYLKQATADKILAEAGESSQQVTHAHLYIALDLLSKGDPDARTHLQRCVEANAFTSNTHQLALALLAHMERYPDWPNSLRQPAE